MSYTETLELEQRLAKAEAELAALRAQLAQAQPLLDAAVRWYDAISAIESPSLEEYRQIRTELADLIGQHKAAQAASAAKG